MTMMKYLLFITLMSVSAVTISNAAQTTWIGNNGNWNNPSNWTLGAVPTAADDVFINNGSVEITAGYIALAQSVFIEQNGTLNITPAGYLIVDGANSTTPVWSGVDVEGALNIHGRLIIRNTLAGSGLSVYQNQSTYVGPSGILNIINTDVDGISVAGNMVNDGFIFMENIGNHGIINYGTFTNTDRVSMQLLDASGMACWGNADFNNLGEFTVKGAQAGIVTSGSNNHIVNEQSGEIYISYVDEAVTIAPWNNNTFDNFGHIDATVHINHKCLNVGGTFNNEASGTLQLGHAFNGIEVVFNGIFSNWGDIELQNSIQFFSILNRSQFVNAVCGTITLHDAIRNQFAFADLLNEGKIYNRSTSMISSNTGSFINNGLIEDNPGTLIPIVNNQEVIVKALNGNVQEGVPVSNFLELNNLDHYIFRGCYTSTSLNTWAGWYNSSQNEWTPNAAAVGLTSVYLQAGYRDNNNTLCTTVVEIEIPNGVQPFASSPAPSSRLLSPAVSSPAEARLFPNPNSGRFTLKVQQPLSGIHTIQVYNSIGILVWEEQQSLEQDNVLTVEIGHTLPKGYYQVMLRKDNVLIQNEKMVLMPE
jgi:hypothetical protein